MFFHFEFFRFTMSNKDVHAFTYATIRIGIYRHVENSIKPIYPYVYDIHSMNI